MDEFEKAILDWQQSVLLRLDAIIALLNWQKAMIEKQTPQHEEETRQ